MISHGQSKSKSHHFGEDNRFLVFSLGVEQFAIPLLKVKEVIASVETRPIPHSPPHFKGLMNLRGVIIAVIDLRVKMKVNKRDNGSETSIIILDGGSESLGVVVDSVDYVANLLPEEISVPPTVHGGGAQSEFITGVFNREKKMILLLDIMSSLGIEDLNLIRKQSQVA